MLLFGAYFVLYGALKFKNLVFFMLSTRKIDIAIEKRVNRVKKNILY